MPGEAPDQTIIDLLKEKARNEEEDTENFLEKKQLAKFKEGMVAITVFLSKNGLKQMWKPEKLAFGRFTELGKLLAT
jgi:hypothetical protein